MLHSNRASNAHAHFLHLPECLWAAGRGLILMTQTQLSNQIMAPPSAAAPPPPSGEQNKQCLVGETEMKSDRKVTHTSARTHTGSLCVVHCGIGVLWLLQRLLQADLQLLQLLQQLLLLLHLLQLVLLQNLSRRLLFLQLFDGFEFLLQVLYLFVDIRVAAAWL